MVINSYKNFRHALLLAIAFISAHTSFTLEESQALFSKVSTGPKPTLSQIEQKEIEVRGLVDAFGAYDGFCPNIKAETCWLILCCPCFLPCFAANAICEICSCPDSRVIRAKRNVRSEILVFKNLVRSFKDRDKIKEYNAYILSLEKKNARSAESGIYLYLFDGPLDLKTFLINPEPQEPGPKDPLPAQVDDTKNPPEYSK
jgi:hypothetical protein